MNETRRLDVTERRRLARRMTSVALWTTTRLEPGTTVALYSPRHGRFARMHSSGNMDRSWFLPD